MTTPEASPTLSATAAACQHQGEADLRTIDVAARVTRAALVALGCNDDTACIVGAAVLAAVGDCEERDGDVPVAVARFADALAGRQVRPNRGEAPTFSAGGDPVRG